MRSLLLVLLLVISQSSYGHPGGLDSNGCHNNRKDGVYQCHQGTFSGKSFSSKSEMLRTIGASTATQNDELTYHTDQNSLEVIQGRVVAITDGDTVTILMNNKQYKIRLAEIDTPERAQPYGSKSKEILSELVFGKDVTANIQDRDRYGRYVARIYQGELDVSREMVKVGAAWVYRQYLTDKSLMDVEQEAKVAKRGLWALPEAYNLPPWEWRRR